MSDEKKDDGPVDEVRRARIEVLRCRRNVARGGDADFWIRRLGRAADLYEKAAATLREQIAAMLAERAKRGGR